MADETVDVILLLNSEGLSTARSVRPFTMPGSAEVRAPAAWKSLVGAELHHCVSCDDYQKTATWRKVNRRGGSIGRPGTHLTSENDLNAAPGRDRASATDADASDAALSPQEDLQ